MRRKKSTKEIRLHGVRHNNLKNFDLVLPTGKLIVVTGVSGSGKSSLAFDTLYAEGQRRYIETFSPYARQFFDRMDKPQVDRIEGIPPAIAIEQRNAVKTTRSTVGTMTEICDYMKVVWPHVARLYCKQCGQPVQVDSPQFVWDTCFHINRKPLAPILESEVSVRRYTVVAEPTNAQARSDHHRGGYGPPTGASAALLALNEANPAYGFSEVPSEVLITFSLPISEKLTLAESLALVQRQGYQRLLHGVGDPSGQGRGFSPQPLEILRTDEALESLSVSNHGFLTVIQDRLRLVEKERSRFTEACEQAYHFGKGKLTVYQVAASSVRDGISVAEPQAFSNRFHCASCDLEYKEPSAPLFSFNHPVGACPACRGFGRIITIDYNLAIPDRSRSLKGGAVKPWQTGQGAECQRDLMRFCQQSGIPTDIPFSQLPAKSQQWVLNGDPDYGTDSDHEWPRAWYGVKGYFRWLESKAYKMHVRVLLSRYRSYTPCPDCLGRRFQPEALLYKIEGEAGRRLTLADFYQMTVGGALQQVERLESSRLAIRGNHFGAFTDVQKAGNASDPLVLALREVHSRLAYLDEVGLSYLTLDRPTRSLSGGETERVNLTTCLGSRLVNTLFVLDEPSVGLHPRDTSRLVRILERLRDGGNTVLVVEHEGLVMRAADEIVDLGPGHGEAGGSVVFQGSYNQILRSARSLTGQYLAGRKLIQLPSRRPVSSERPRLKLSHVSIHNLSDLAVEIPLGRFVCVTGVSGSGKTTLIREALLPACTTRLASPTGSPEVEAESEAPVATANGSQSSFALEGVDHLGRVLLVDQGILGRTPRSNPAVYVGAFDHLRELFAQTDRAQQLGLNASAFSFNSTKGQCENCRGAGFEKIEMQFLSDVYIRCPDCEGRRYRSHILEVKLSPPAGETNLPHSKRSRSSLSRGRSIADMLESTIDQSIEFLGAFPDSSHAIRAIRSLSLLQQVGLGYLRLGQPINTLSGGECQRLKLVSHLAEFARAEAKTPKPTLFLFDEPTTGLHFDDVRVLLSVFQRLVDEGHSVVVIEHNLDVIKSADWVIDLGPEAGQDGGQIVAVGTPEQVAHNTESHTGSALRAVLD